MGKLRDLQSEQGPWTLHNFGEHSALIPATGIVEELGELDEAIMSMEPEKAIDSIGDAMIYMADLSNVLAWDLEQDVWGARRSSRLNSLLVWGGRLLHSALKSEQGIRGCNHNADAKHACQVLAWMLDVQAARLGVDLVDETWKVWEKVRLRDWKANRETGETDASQ